MTLLEAFVYDPLLDWTGHDTGILASFYGGGTKQVVETEQVVAVREGRRVTEKRMTERLFKIRLEENKSVSVRNEEKLMRLLGKMSGKLVSLCDLMVGRDAKEEKIRMYDMAKIYLDESLTLHGDGAKNKGITVFVLN